MNLPFAATALTVASLFSGYASALPIPQIPSSFNLREDARPEEATIAPVPAEPPFSYVVLLPGPDGGVGSVIVRSQSGEQVISKANQGAALDGGALPFDVSKDQLGSDFGPALAASPALPEKFLLYFELGSTKLTADSRPVLPRVLDRARARQTADISITGHTDTLGTDASNEALGLKRADAIATQIRKLDVRDIALTVESHGERNLQVATPDETNEPRNRRVEISVR